jgi:photosystem II stability/assembly factor-like uncharacterized protein
VWIRVVTILLVGIVLGQAWPTGAAGGAAPWALQTSGTQQPLYAVACLSASRCKAVGAAGTIIYSKDGGSTWKAQANPLAGSSTTLYRISCLAPSTCYAIGRPNTILVTHNGGATWGSHVIPLTGIGAGLTDQACVSRQSYDIRGRPALCRVGLLDISCVNARVCYVVASSSAPGKLCSTSLCLRPSSIWMTDDAGASWVKQSIPPSVPCEGDCTPANQRFVYPLEWVSCLRTGLCRAGGTQFVASHEGFTDAVIATTRPGGPWTLLNPTDSRFSPDAAKCPTSTRCYGVFSTNPTDLETGNLVFLSTDGGVTWQSRTSGSNQVRNDIACPTAKRCYTVDDHGTITQTTNGTTFVTTSSPTARNLYGIKCVGATTCYAVGSKGTILTHR